MKDVAVAAGVSSDVVVPALGRTGTAITELQQAGVHCRAALVLRQFQCFAQHTVAVWPWQLHPRTEAR